MAKHRFPIRVRAAREGIKSGRRLVIIGATILAMGGAGVGIAMADTTTAPGQNSGQPVITNNCDANHGAFGALGNATAPGQNGGATYHQDGNDGQYGASGKATVPTTGSNNSSDSAYCQTVK